MTALLTTIISGLFIAFVTSILTVRLALWRFYSEKWWERKAELYSRLMEALYDMHLYHREWLDDYESQGGEESHEKEQKRKERSATLLSRHHKAQDEVRKIVVIGSFIVSDAVANDLMQMREEHDEVMADFSNLDIYDVVGTSMKSIEDCLTRVREHAKQDLRVTRKLPPILEKVAPTALTLAMRTIGLR